MEAAELPCTGAAQVHMTAEIQAAPLTAPPRSQLETLVYQRVKAALSPHK